MKYETKYGLLKKYKVVNNWNFESQIMTQKEINKLEHKEDLSFYEVKK